ncbi:MAG: aldehyde dehydrogenase family protein [Pseudomonadota bacterium]
MRTALLLVDVQRDFFDRAGLSPRPTALVAQIASLLESWRGLDLPVFHVRSRIRRDGSDRMPHWQHRDIWACVEGTPGYDPPDGLAALPGEQIFHKGFFSAFGSSGLEPALRRDRITRLAIAGLYTHGCIRATVFDAYERGFGVWVADDAIGSTEATHAEITRAYLDGRAAVFMPTAELLDRLTPAAVATSRVRVAAGGRMPSTRSQILCPPEGDREPAGRRAFSTQDAVATACTCAAASAVAWAATAPAARAELLDRWAELLQHDQEDLIGLLVDEIGKTRADALDELRRMRGHIRVAAGLCRRACLTEIAAGVQVRYRPRGTVGLITPWNNPLAIPVGKLAPALAFGNSCVWKPAPQAPECARRLRATLTEAGLPEGVVELVQGDGITARQLVVSPLVDAVSVTGSVETGRAIAALCTAAGKPLQAELGGNNAAVILDDWHIDEQAAHALALAVFGFGGQRCTAIRRLLVQRGIYDDFLAAFSRAVAGLRIGDPRDERTHVGPLISRAHRERVRASVEEAVAGGARIVAQAQLPAELSGDCWMAPVVLGAVRPDNPIVREETFGPVAVVLPVEDLDEAIALANAVPQGLVAALYTHDETARHRFADQVQAGMVNLAGGPLKIHPEAPFGGWKASSIGPPEHGIWDRDFYTRPQVIYGDDPESRDP